MRGPWSDARLWMHGLPGALSLVAARPGVQPTEDDSKAVYNTDTDEGEEGQDYGMANEMDI
jgi:hypothetical protein